MTICVNCGRKIDVVSRECPYCHTPITVGNITNFKNIKSQEHDDDNSKLLMILSVFIPVFGIVYYLLYRNELTTKSKNALGGALIGITLILAVIIILFLLKLF